MSDLRKRLLAVSATLMSRLSPEEYLFSADPPKPSPRRSTLHDAIFGAAISLISVLSFWIVLQDLGYRRISPPDETALRIFYQVDPDHEVRSDEELARLWGRLVEGYRLVRTAVATAPNAKVYPYLATVTSHPTPEVDPGIGPAMIALANALDAYPAEVRGATIHNMVVIGAALNEPDVQAGLKAIVDLPTETRYFLFGNQASAFRDVVDLEQDIAKRKAQASSIGSELQTRRYKAASEVQMLKDQLARENSFTPACQRHIAASATCLKQVAPALGFSGGPPSFKTDQ